MERKLGYRCPDCNRKLAEADGMNVATQVVKRKCGGCGQRWQIVIVPASRTIGSGLAYFDAGTFVRIQA